ncbi:MAG: hypothetical protein Q8797_01880, partial [Candidatus Phytoplasma australasiaticum]|nr:hypothetical protein [Candidatus Phytoplasma australasiaticum]
YIIELMVKKGIESTLIFLNLYLNYRELVPTIYHNIHQLLIVSEINIIKSSKLEIKIIKATGKTCPRCWNVTNYNNSNELCNRCNSVIKQLKTVLI